MFVLVSYDIADDRRRGRVSKLLGDYGTRVLESVFECEVTAAHMQRMLVRLRRVAKAGEDRWRCYVLCQECMGRIVADRPLERPPRTFIV